MSSGRPASAYVAASQCSPVWETGTIRRKGNTDMEAIASLNVVRSGRPEQSVYTGAMSTASVMSQCSPVWETGTIWSVRVACPVSG